MKLILVGWYNLIYPVITAKEHFEILGYEVYFLPLLYCCEKYKGETLFNALYSFINNIDPNVILWWNWECPQEVMFKLKEKTNNVLHCLFNWDHPYCLSEWDNKHNRKITSKNIWDICFVTADYKLDQYRKSGSKEAYYLRMFADSEVHFPEDDDSYKCDISLVCVNLYTDTEKYPNTINRKEIVENLIKENLNIRLYGPEHLKNDFPNHYYGFANFLDNHKIFYNSKINLCTHVANGYKYCNERVGTILSSGGLILCDKVDGIDQILTDGLDCVLLDKNNYVNQIKEILQNYEKYSEIKKNALITAKEKFCPEKWSKFIDLKIKNFIKNNPTKGKSNNPVFTFNNYKQNKVCIVMTYYERLNQIINTLDTIEESNYQKDLIEVICFDDRSSKEPLILDLSKYTYKIKIIYGNFERDESIINSVYSYNNLFKYINSEFVIIQNSECMHIGDIIKYTVENINKNNLISFPCWSSSNEELNTELFINRHNSNNINSIIENKWTELIDYPKEYRGWYNHKLLRPQCLHFCNSLHIETFKKVGIFNTKLYNLLGFDDNDLSERIMFNENIDITIPDHSDVFVVHQYHGKYNKARPTELFLSCYDKYRSMNNYRINNTNYKKEKIINVNYSDIVESEFYNNIDKIWSIYIVNIIIKINDVLNINFLRKCLKKSNIRILYDK